MDFKTDLAAAFLLSIGLVSCIDIPNDFVAPVWDVTLEVPVVNRSYTLAEAVEKDSLIKAYDDPDRLGLLYYSDSIDVDAIEIGDNVTFEGFSETISQKLGAVRINNVDPVYTDIAISDWTPISPGTSILFPEVENNISKEFTPITAFESATLESGSALITFINKLPVETELRNFKIENSADNSVLIENPDGDPVTIAAFDSITVTYDLTEKVIRDQLVFVAILYTPGSDGEHIEVPAEAGTTIKAEFSDLVIRQAKAKFPVQDPFGIDDQISIGDSIYFESALLKYGSLNLLFDNFIDLNLELELEIENLKRPDGASYSHIINLQRNERNRLVNIPDLGGWRLEAPLSGQLTNMLSYSVTVQATESNEVVTLQKDDSVGVNINLGESTFEYFSGRIKPTSYNMEERSFDLNLGEVDNNFGFGEVSFANPGITLDILSSSNVEFELDGILTASNSIDSHSILLENVLINNTSNSQIDLKDFGIKELLNSFSQALPDKFQISGKMTINPNYEIISVSSDDKILIRTGIEIPLNVGIGDGSFSDTLYLDTADSSEAIENINYASLTMELTNSIPISIEVTGLISDTDGTGILNIPPDYNTIDAFIVPSPSVDENGNIIESGVLTQKFELYGEDARKFLNSPDMLINLKLLTPPVVNTTPVKFRTTDSVHVKLFGTVEYRVDPEGLDD